jgi:hypothetical protein
MLMKFFLLVVFDILFEPSSVFPARISILLLRFVVVDLKPSGDGGALILLLEEEEEEETARALLASFDESENEEDEGAINARIVCVFMCMYVYIICA